MSSKGDFVVTVRREEVVSAVLPIQEHWLPQSNLDLLLPPVDVGVFFCYKKPTAAAGENKFSCTFGQMVSVLKKAMAQTLVSYYALAGEVVQNTMGEPEVLCNNRGVDFIEAFADIELIDLNLYNPDESIEGKLVPQKKEGILSVQATELKCGGLVVGCTFDHRVADAYSINMFLVSWAEMAQSKPMSHLPIFRRSLLNPRRPGTYDATLDNMYVPIAALPPPAGSPCDQLVSRIYTIGSHELSELQKLACAEGFKRTKLEAFSAFLWKMVASSSKNRDIDTNKICRMGIVVDGRSRVGNEDIEKGEMMGLYFGNVLSIPFGEKKIREVTEMSLSRTADVIHESLENAATKDHFLGLIDWVEAHRPEPALAKIYGGGQDDGPAVVVSSGQRFPASKVDFGWGKPTLGSYHFPWGGQSGYVMPMPSPIGNGDWVVYMHLLKKQMDHIEKQAAHFFKPLTSDYLNL